MPTEKNEVLKISLERKPDMLGMNACHVNVQIQGDPHKLAQMFALILKQYPGLLALTLESLVNLDNVVSVKTFSDQ